MGKRLYIHIRAANNNSNIMLRFFPDNIVSRIIHYMKEMCELDMNKNILAPYNIYSYLDLVYYNISLEKKVYTQENRLSCSATS